MTGKPNPERTAALRAEVLRWSRPDRTSAEVARLAGVSRSTASHYLGQARRAGDIPRPDPRLGRGRRIAYRTPARDRLIDAGAAALAADGRTATEIAALTGVDFGAVTRWATAAGIRLQRGGIPSHEATHGQEMRRMAARGLDATAIGTAVGLDPRAVRRWARREGVRVRRGNRAPQPDARRDALESGLTFAAAAKRCGVTTPALVRWAKIHGVRRASRATLTSRTVAALLTGTWRLSELAIVARVDESLLLGILEEIAGAGIVLRRIGGGRRWSADLPVREIEAAVLSRLSTETWMTTRDLAEATRQPHDIVWQALHRLERSAQPRVIGKRGTRDATEREWQLPAVTAPVHDPRRESPT